MKKNIHIISLVILTTFVTCGFDSSPVAHYKYSAIKMGEVKARAQDAKLTKQLTRSLAETICVEGMALHEARERSYEKSEIYQLKRERQIQPIIARVVDEKVRKELDLSREYVKCRHIAFRGGKKPEDRNAARDKADEVITLLIKGVKFDSLIKSYSDNPERAIDESIVYVVKGGGMPEFENIAFSMKTGSFSMQPVILPDGTAVVMIVEKRGKMEFDDVVDDVENAFECKRLTELFTGIANKKRIEYLEKNNNGSFKIRSLPKDNKAVLFSVAGREYTLKELKHRRDLLADIVHEPIQNETFIIGFAREWYISELYKNEAEKQGYLKEKGIASEIQHATEFILAHEYIRYVSERDIVLSEQELLNEYNHNKNHYMKLPPSPKDKPIQLSFQQARVFVRKNLLQGRIAEKTAEWEKRALEESGLTFID
jgi:parvulin-like peptidyl-prolyl isomerase